jgi:hypothetical protein
MIPSDYFKNGMNTIICCIDNWIIVQMVSSSLTNDRDKNNNTQWYKAWHWHEQWHRRASIRIEISCSQLSVDPLCFDLLWIFNPWPYLEVQLTVLVDHECTTHNTSGPIRVDISNL